MKELLRPVGELRTLEANSLLAYQGLFLLNSL